MGNKIKRILSLALAFMLLLSYVPSAAMAEQTGEAPAMPTATVTEIQNEKLTFAMNFTTDEASDEQLAYYGEWHADFVLTVNKDVTFNANGGADGYLSGQYDKWSENWVNVPFENVTLKANESLKIMEYAAKLMNQPGLKYTYAEVYEDVKDFDCGVYFTPEFLAANPDLEVTLELRMFDPADETKSYLIGNTYTYTIPEMPTATVTEIQNENLTFALNFVADTASYAQLKWYGEWYADFVLTVNKDVTFNANGGADGYLSGQYDAWSENWVSVPFEDVTLKANESLKIMEYAAKLMNQPGLKYTYAEVYEDVKDFDCGVYFTPEFLAANPDLEVTLELRMFDPADETKSYLIGEAYSFPEMPTATVTKIPSEDLTFALNFVADQATPSQMKWYGQWYADFVLTVNKDVTFNANGGANGYLSGQYDAWSENWVNVPFDDVTLKANESLKIMEYAAKLMNQPGLKYTYAEVHDVVKDFDCGVYFTPEFLAANPDLEVTLELRMFNPVDETQSYVIGDTYIFTIPELPTATVTEVNKEDLTFALNFVADKATDEQLDYYGNWYADYVLTVNEDVTFNANGGANGYLSGQYDAWSENWVNVPFEDVTLKANESLKIMEYAAELLGESGLKYTYAEVYDVVKDFDCGVSFTPEYLVAHPNLEVTLELRVFNPENEDISYVIGKTYVFKNDFVAQNTTTKKLYSVVKNATMEAKEGETVILVKDATDDLVPVLDNRKFDLNGHTLTASHVTCYGHIIDSSEDNSGLLKVEKTRILIQKNNEQLPVKTAEGYKFVEVLRFNYKLKDGPKYVFQPLFEEAAHALLREGMDVTGVTIMVRVSWKQEEGTRTQDFVYNDTFVKGYIDSYEKLVEDKYAQQFFLTLTGAENIEDLTFTAVVRSDVGVEFVSPPSK